MIECKSYETPNQGVISLKRPWSVIFSTINIFSLISCDSSLFYIFTELLKKPKIVLFWNKMLKKGINLSSVYDSFNLRTKTSKPVQSFIIAYLRIITERLFLSIAE